ncbi:hypothetical protein PV325_014073 [Microctonus aethiopoides]|nr:hypothetical protein PV325_014073 [Microctonus aethiopoides]
MKEKYLSQVYGSSSGNSSSRRRIASKSSCFTVDFENSKQKRFEHPTISVKEAKEEDEEEEEKEKENEKEQEEEEGEERRRGLLERPLEQNETGPSWLTAMIVMLLLLLMVVVVVVPCHACYLQENAVGTWTNR